MEGFTGKLMKGLRRRWRKKRGYERLDGSGRRRKTRVEVLGGGGRRRRFWRVRLGPRIRILRGLSPKKMLVRLRDAYVNMMLAIANSRVLASGAGATIGYGCAYGHGLPRPAVKEYDDKMIVEMYKLMIAQQAPFTGIA